MQDDLNTLDDLCAELRGSVEAGRDPAAITGAARDLARHALDLAHRIEVAAIDAAIAVARTPDSGDDPCP